MTCAVLENDAVQVIPDESRLAGAVVAMAPYEVVASQHAEDLHSGQRRFFQYQYTMRIINPDAIGSDVPIPIMSLHYRINSRIAENASVQGRDLTYVLPPHTVRILSLVAVASLWRSPDPVQGSPGRLRLHRSCGQDRQTANHHRPVRPELDELPERQQDLQARFHGLVSRPLRRASRTKLVGPSRPPVRKPWARPVTLTQLFSGR